MTQKYFIGKCGGEDCMFRTGVILGEHQCLKDIEKCSKERCQNCPHGKTAVEWAEKSAQTRYEIKRAQTPYPALKWSELKAEEQSKLIARETVFIKALLGGEQK